MQVVPVIDIRHGQVVKAIAGDRANYRPIETPLFSGSAPRDAIRGFMALHPFPVIYIADLDAIEGRDGNAGMLKDLSGTYPGCAFWIDQGASKSAQVAEALLLPNTVAVIGTETGVTLDGWRTLHTTYGDERLVLSLDYRADQFLGDRALLADAPNWPRRVIAMTLGSVGTNAGPDLATLLGLKTRHPTGEIYAAGGVRDATDLRVLRAAGISGALVASALHSQKIKAGDLV